MRHYVQERSWVYRVAGHVASAVPAAKRRLLQEVQPANCASTGSLVTVSTTSTAMLTACCLRGHAYCPEVFFAATFPFSQLAYGFAAVVSTADMEDIAHGSGYSQGSLLDLIYVPFMMFAYVHAGVSGLPVYQRRVSFAA